MTSMPPAAPQTKGKMSPIIWILIILAGIFVLGVVGVVGAGYYFARNPGLVMAKLITAANPDAEVMSTDTGSQTVRIRDRKTGEEVTLSFDDIKKGKLKFSARGKDGEVADVEIGGGGKLPSWVPTYPGATAQGTISAKGQSDDGTGEGGMITFTTSDSASKVTEFYENRLKDMGMRIDLTQRTGDGGMIVGDDEARQRTLQIMVGQGSGDTSFTVTYGRKR
jgi:hypothetical protein